MKKIKVADATGPVLDWLVAKAAGIETYKSLTPIYWEDDRTQVPFEPSTDWAQGGPIIEREHLSVYPFFIDGRMSGWSSCDPHHLQYDENGEIIEGSDFVTDGPTALIAAMRCYVTSKLGNEVEVPEELLA